MTNTTTNTILVIGSTGKTGTRVTAQLEKRGIAVRHGSRSADISFAWDNAETWAAAVAGVDKVYKDFRRLRSRDRRDRGVDAVRLNLGERISVARQGSAHSDGNRSRNASRSCCASDTRPRMRTKFSGGRFSSSIPRSHRRNQRFSIEATSCSNSAISPCMMASNIRACATSAGCVGRAHASARWRSGTGARRGFGTHIASRGSSPTSAEIESTHRSWPTNDAPATPRVHRPVKFRWLGVTVHSL
jgi:hypothetical protein